MPINLSSTAESLNEIDRVFSPEYYEPLRVGLEFEGTPSNTVPGRTVVGNIAEARPVNDSYDRASILVGTVLQPYQSGFTPNVTTTIDALSTRLERGKVDILFDADELDKLRNRWLFDWGKWENQDPIRWSFAAWLYANRIVPQTMDDLNNVAWAGVKATPTAGTAGTVLQSFTGFRKRIADYITATLTTPIATGEITAANVLSKIETFIDGIPAVYRARGGKILCSDPMRRNYWKAYRAAFGAGAGNNNPNEGNFIDDTNIQLNAVLAMGNSNRLIYMPNGVDTLIFGTKIGEATPMPAIRWEAHERTLKGMMEIHRFYDVEHPQDLFVNDQL